MVLGCANSGFGCGFGGNGNGDGNENIFVGSAVSYSSLLSWIQSSSRTSNSLLLWQDVCKYNNDSDALRSNTEQGPRY